MRYLTMDDKAEIILDYISPELQGVSADKKKKVLHAIIDALVFIEEKQPTRTLNEIQNIVDTVRAGIPVQIEYSEPGEDDFENEYVAKACW